MCQQLSEHKLTGPYVILIHSHRKYRWTMVKAENFKGFKEDTETMKCWPLCAWPLCFWMYSFFGGTPCIFQCVFSQIINLVNTWSQSCHKIMKNGEGHWLVIDCDARFVTDRNHKSNKVCHKEGLASLASSSHQIRLINTQWTAFFHSKARIVIFWKENKNEGRKARLFLQILKVCQSRLLLLD